MFILRKLFAGFFTASLVVVWLLVAGGVMVLVERTRRVGRWLVVGGVALLVLLSLGVPFDPVGQWLEARHPALVDASGLAESGEVEWVVVLGGGHRARPELPLSAHLNESSVFRAAREPAAIHGVGGRRGASVVGVGRRGRGAGAGPGPGSAAAVAARSPGRRIELSSVRLCTNSRRWTHPRSPRFCYDGDWDVEHVYPPRSIFEPEPEGSERFVVHETIRALFLEGRDHRTTPRYELMLRRLAERPGVPLWGCLTPGDVDEYFHRPTRAFESMKKHGYLTQTELGNTRNPADEEARIYLTSGGEPVQGSGANHRTRMAEILGIDRVPCVVRGGHAQWMTRLSQVHGQPPHEVMKRRVMDRDPDSGVDGPCRQFQPKAV